MSATMGAALKKIAVALLTDKKVIKTIGGIIIGIIIIVVMPIVAVVSFFNGSMDIDTDKLNQSIQENISAEQMENLQLINDTMTEVENQLKNKKLSDYNTQAEVIYLFSLSDKSEDQDFVKNFVSCFKKNQSDEDLIKAVNQKFGTEIKYDEFQKMMQSIKGAEISTAGFTDKTTKNNLDLVKWCENAYKNGWGYVYGGYGQVCTKQYLDQQASLFPGNNEAGGEMRKVGEKWLGKRVCDCIGLIKSYVGTTLTAEKLLQAQTVLRIAEQTPFGAALLKADRFQICPILPDLPSGWTDISECISATEKSSRHKAQPTELSKLSSQGEVGQSG